MVCCSNSLIVGLQVNMKLICHDAFIRLLVSYKPLSVIEILPEYKTLALNDTKLSDCLLEYHHLNFYFISCLQYDCSAADINPIGSISKTDIRSFLRWAAKHLGYASLAEIEAAPPTAELEPIRSDYTQVFLY